MATPCDGCWLACPEPTTIWSSVATKLGTLMNLRRPRSSSFLRRQVGFSSDLFLGKSRESKASGERQTDSSSEIQEERVVCLCEGVYSLKRAQQSVHHRNRGRAAAAEREHVLRGLVHLISISSQRTRRERIRARTAGSLQQAAAAGEETHQLADHPLACVDQALAATGSCCCSCSGKARTSRLFVLHT